MNELPPLLKELLDTASKLHPELNTAFQEFQKTGDPNVLLNAINEYLSKPKEGNTWLN